MGSLVIDVFMNTQHLLLMAALAYGIGAVLALAGLRGEALRKGPWQHLAAVIALSLHTAGIGYHCAGSTTHFFSSTAEMLWLLAWTLGIGCVALLVGLGMRTVGALVLPVITALLVLSRFTAQTGAPPPLEVAGNPLLPIHIASAFLGYGLFLTACAASILYLESHRLLKRKLFGVLFHSLPSLEKLERAITVCSWAGFAVFTLALGTGAYLAKRKLGEGAWYLEPKTLLTQATWLVFLVLVVGRVSGRMAGRASARAVLMGAALVVATFLVAHPFREETAPKPDQAREVVAFSPVGRRPRRAERVRDEGEARSNPRCHPHPAFALLTLPLSPRGRGATAASWREGAA